MLEVVEKLQTKRDRLTKGFNKTRIVYRTEIKKIDAAVRKFTNAYTALQIILPEAVLTTKKSRTAAIAEMLAEHGSMTVKSITAELLVRGYSTTVQSASGILQINAGKGLRFKRVAPATFALLETESLSAPVKSGKKAKLSSK